jgi:hypothetical protein
MPEQRGEEGEQGDQMGFRKYLPECSPTHFSPKLIITLKSGKGSTKFSLLLLLKKTAQS